MPKTPLASPSSGRLLLSHTRLLAISGLLLLLFLFLAAAAYYSGRTVERSSRLISIDAVPGWQIASSMRLSISVAARACVEIAVTSDAASIPGKIAEARAAEAAFREALVRYETTSHIHPDADQRLLSNVADRHAVFSRELEAFASLAVSGRRPEALQIFEHRLIPAFRDVIREAEILINFNQTNAISLTRDIAGDIHTMRATVLVVLCLATVCVLVLVVNFLARRETQRLLVASEKRLRDTLDNLVVFVGLCDPSGVLVEANRTALDAAGVSREAVVGGHFPDLPWWSHSPDARAKVRDALARAADGRSSRFDTDNLLADGKPIAVDFSCGPIRDAEGRVTGIVVSGIDITGRKQLEAQFIRAQRIEAVGTLSAGLAHDLNNILAPILMASGLLRLRHPGPDDLKILDMIAGGAQRGAGIIRQLLAFGRGVEGDKHLLRLRHVLKEAAHLVEETFPRKIAFSIDAPADLRPVVGDPTQLHQVVLNLCVNARDAMPGGGALSLSAANIDIDETGASVHPDALPGPYVRIRVSDTGEGIPRENIGRIFDPFFTTKPAGRGTGLGLFSVLGIVRNHRGFMTVDSEPGRGTVFDIHLPAAEPAAEEKPAPADDRPLIGAGELVLLVDDESAMREVTRKTLEAHGYRVICAVNGADAIRLFLANQNAVRVVVTDIDMPVMGGIELVKALRVASPGMRCVVLAGSASPETHAILETLALDDILEKPFSVPRLLGSLHKILASPVRT